MDFVDWWKKSSKEATEAHYEQRFDANELNDIRRGLLNDSAKHKVQLRLNSLKKRNTALWVGCGIPLIFIGLAIIGTLGFVFFRALWQNSGNPVAWGFAIFFVVIVTIMLGLAVYALFLWLRQKSSTQMDLQSNKVSSYRGKVFINITRTENGFNISYSINKVEILLMDDAIGWEIHTHFFGSPNITGQSSRETKEEYVFYCLPESKRLIHFELA